MSFRAVGYGSIFDHLVGKKSVSFSVTTATTVMTNDTILAAVNCALAIITFYEQKFLFFHFSKGIAVIELKSYFSNVISNTYDVTAVLFMFVMAYQVNFGFYS